MGRRGIAQSAFTLIELLVAITIASILTGVVVFMFKASFDAYFLAQQEILLEKGLDEALTEVAQGGFEIFGTKDSLEVLDATPTSLTFVNLWIDDSHTPKPEHEISDLVAKNPFTLNRPHKPGTFVPIAEISQARTPRGEAKRWHQVPIIFIPGEADDPRKRDDKVFLKYPVPPASKIRFIYRPDATHFPDSAMTIEWEDGKITRTYRGKRETVPKYTVHGVTITDFKLEYYDNTNTEVEPKPESIPNITAIKINLVASLKNDFLKGFTFINLRNTRTGGRGIVIQKGTRLKIPNSEEVRVFSIANITGFRQGDIIELEARPQSGPTWKIRLELDFDSTERLPAIKEYSIEYPAGTEVYSEAINLTTDLSLNFMTLGPDSLYDYDFDKEGDNMVNLKGKVELIVTTMDASGASLFIRP